MYLVLTVIITLPLGYLLYKLTTSEISDENPDEKYEWVVGFYVCGEGFDDGIVDEDISDTIGLSSDRISFQYLVDYDGFGNTQFFSSSNYTRKQQNISFFMPYDSTELDMGSKEVLNGFTTYLTNISAEQYCLVIWGHGKGYEGVCFDGDSKLTTSEINSSLIGKGIDILVFDACEMVCAEVLYDLLGTCDLVVGTEKDLPDRGLDYSGGFTRFLRDEEHSPVPLGKNIIGATRDYYATNPSTYSLQLSMVDMDRYQDFIRMFISQNEYIYTSLPPTFESGSRFDLGLFLVDNGYSDLCSELNRSVKQNLILPSSEGVDVQGVMGISILSPEVDNREDISLLDRVQMISRDN